MFSYKEDVVSRLNEIFLDDLSVIGTIMRGSKRYDVYLAVMGMGDNNVLLSAGTHGDEPAGVFAVLDFLEHESVDYVDDYTFYAYPCINPVGFDKGLRANYRRININRDFKQKSSSREAGFVKKSLKKNINYLFSMDFHETGPDICDDFFDVNECPLDYFIYETCSQKKLRVGREIIKEISHDIKICDWKDIYGDTNSMGVVWYPEGCLNPEYIKGTTLDAYLNANYTNHSFTVELPLFQPMDVRVNAGVKTLCTALKEVPKKLKKQVSSVNI